MKWAMLAAAGITTVGVLPIFLLSAQAVLVSQDLGFTDFQLGMAVTVFFSAAAIASLPVGRLAERLGRRTSVTGAGLLATVSLLGLAVVPPSYAALLAFLILGGVANATAQVSANLLLAQVVPPSRHGLAFGIKQSAVPISTLIGGLAVPTIGLTVGWRWAFVAAAVTAFAVAFAAPLAATRRFKLRGEVSAGTLHVAAAGPLIWIAMATALASAATNALGAFLVVWAVRVGLELGSAGLLLAGASALCITARVGSGIAADRRGRRNLPVVAAQLAVGAIGLVVLSTGGTTALVVGALVAFGVGWSWPGLLLLAVVKASPGTPAAATSIIQAGAFIGGASGPGLFGLLLQVHSFAAAWMAAAISLLLAAVLVLVGRHLLILDLTRKPPAASV